jgi:hypothetical protein
MSINPYQSPQADCDDFDDESAPILYSVRWLRIFVAPAATAGGSLLATAVQLSFWGRPTDHAVLLFSVSAVVSGAVLGMLADLLFPLTDRA